MTGFDDQRAAQAAAMADPDRLRVLALVLAAPNGEVTAVSLAGGGDPTAFARHLQVMAEVGLLFQDDDSFRPTHDALVRFGSLVGDWSADPGGPAEDDIGVVAIDYGDHDRLLRVVEAELIATHVGVLAPETVRRFVRESYDLLASRARVRRYLPQLTARFAADRLAALASLEQCGGAGPTDVLFVCVHNTGRSQIAAALTRARAGDGVRIRAAGSAPGPRLDPVVRAELARLGVDGLAEFPRPLTDEVVRASGVVITLGCGDACPVVPGRRYVDWPVADPAGRPAPEVRRIIADIAQRVEGLLFELGLRPEATAPLRMR